MLNSVEIMGHISTDPKMFDLFDDENPVCLFFIDCERDEVDEAGEKIKDSIGCIAFNEMASLMCANYITGMPIHIWGRLFERTWEDRDGNLFRSTDILVQKTAHEGEDKRERGENGEFIRKTQREQRLHRRAVGELMRKKYGAPSWEDLFDEDEMKNLSSEQKNNMRKEREKEYFEKKGLPDPHKLVSLDETETLSIKELDQLLEQRTEEWFSQQKPDEFKNLIDKEVVNTNKHFDRYFLEQKFLPQCLFGKDRERLICALIDRKGEFLVDVLNRIGEDSGHKCPYRAEQFTIKPVRVNGSGKITQFGMIIIQMPKPEAMSLCSHIIICHDFDLKNARYYTIEKTLGINSYMLCGVSADGCHFNNGGAPRNEQGIVSEVRELYLKDMSRQ